MAASLPIYMDYFSTTPVDPRVVSVVATCMSETFGNPASVDHCFGTQASEVVERARQQVAQLVGAKRGKVIFTSGATEAINIVIRQFARERKAANRPLRLLLLPVEHPAVLETSLDLAKHGEAEVRFLSVDDKGRLELKSLEHELQLGADLVCVMAANNETGNIYPIDKVASICADFGIRLLCDASQAAGKQVICFDDWRLSYMIVSAHKMYGPKGVGALITNRECLPIGVYTGGNQEFGIRPGTINVPAIAGFGEAAKLRMDEMEVDEVEIRKKRDRLQQLLVESIPNLVVNGDLDSRLAGALHISVPGVPNDAVITRIRDTLAISRGAACSSGIEKPSHVLSAMKLNDGLIEGAFRISLGRFTTESEVEFASNTFRRAVLEVMNSLNSTICGKVS